LLTNRNEGFLKTDLGKFYYQEHGPQDAPAIVFSHGVAMDHRSFDAQVRALDAQYRVVTWDMPFHGRSDAIEKDVSFSAVSADLLAKLLGVLTIEQAVFAGLSLGSFIVQQMTARHPQMVRAEVHISGGPLYPKFPSLMGISIPVITAFMKLYPERPLARAFAKHKALKDETQAYLLETIDRTGKAAVTHLTNEMVRDMAAGLPAPPDKPRLIVYGDHDIPFIINMSKKWHKRLPGSELAEIEQAHHILNQDNPAAFNVILREFLERTV
jgi:3-oxoadipate enol-lactonase